MSKYDMRMVQNNPGISKKRSYIPFMKHKSQIDMNVGLLYPLDRCWEVLPGDTFKVRHSLSLRMTNPPKVPVMDQLAFDIFYFYVPLRIIWNDFDTFITGDVGTDWTEVSDLTIPTLYFDTGEGDATAYEVGSLLDYLSCPLVTTDIDTEIGVNVLPFRGYYKIWNWWFRYESLQEELYLYEGSNNIQYIPGAGVSGAVIGDIYNSSYIDRYMEALRTNAVQCGWLAPVCKLQDVYSRCLPQPLAGPDISILGGLENPIRLNNPFMVGQGQFPEEDPDDYYDDEMLVFKGNGTVSNSLPGLPSSELDDYLSARFKVGGVSNDIVQIGGNLVGLSGNTIRDLRQAFAIEQVFTIEARYSRRLPDWTIGMFGVNVPDLRVQQPEMLGHTRIYVNVNQVIQSSASEVNSPQGNVGAWSQTNHSGFDFVSSFCEHGYIYCLGCIRVLNRTYSQGLEKMYMRKTRFDFYLPPLANISDQPVNTFELLAENNGITTDVFAWQEAWYEYKYLPNHVSGHCRPNVANTIALWNYAEYFSSVPYFSEEFIIEPAYGIDRTMHLSSSVDVCQFILDMYFDVDCYRTMPLHAVPGTLSHFW